MANPTIKEFKSADQLYNYFVASGRMGRYAKEHVEVIYEVLTGRGPDTEVDLSEVRQEFMAFSSLRSALNAVECDDEEDLRRSEFYLYKCRNGKCMLEDCFE